MQEINIDPRLLEICEKSEYPVILDLQDNEGRPFYGIFAIGAQAALLKQRLEPFLKENK